MFKQDRKKVGHEIRVFYQFNEKRKRMQKNKTKKKHIEMNCTNVLF